MRALRILALAALLAGCGGAETKPASGGTNDAPPAPTTQDVTLSIKNEASEPRVVFVETYEPQKGDLTGAPVGSVKVGALGPGESISKTIPVPARGHYRVLGFQPVEGDKDKLKFTGKVVRVQESGVEPPVSVNR